jgi:hypothetical protein
MRNTQHEEDERTIKRERLRVILEDVSELEAAPTVVDFGAMLRERFRCEPLSCTLSAFACAKRHVVAQHVVSWRNDEAARHALSVVESVCRKCEVGAENARRAGL